MKAKLTAATLACCLIVFAAIASAALATGTSASTTSSITARAGEPDSVSGSVRSSNKACRGSRSVIVFEALAGPDMKLGDPIKSNKNGAWELSGDFAFGSVETDVYAAISGKTVRVKVKHRKHKKKVTCKPGRSPDFHIDADDPDPGDDDLDDDGILDVDDPCPDDYAPDGYCPVSIYSVRKLETGFGRLVKLSGARVNAVTADQSQAWIEIQEGDVGFTDADYSAIRLDLDDVSASLSVGDRVDLKGLVADQLGEVVIEVSSLIETANGTPEVAVEITYDDLSDISALALQGVLVKVTQVTLDTTEVGVWTLDNDVLVGDTLIGLLPDNAYPPGTLFDSITGIANPLVGPEIEPRTNADFVPAA